MTDRRAKYYRQRYRDHRWFFLNHLTPATNTEYYYDVRLYITPHFPTDRSLLEINRVRYFLDPQGWGSWVFESVHRTSGFALAPEAMGTFLVTAEIEFHDQQTIIIEHYVDTRMADIKGRRQTTYGQGAGETSA